MEEKIPTLLFGESESVSLAIEEMGETWHLPHRSTAAAGQGFSPVKDSGVGFMSVESKDSQCWKQ